MTGRGNVASGVHRSVEILSEMKVRLLGEKSSPENVRWLKTSVRTDEDWIEAEEGFN